MRTYDVFISHSWNENEKYKKIIEELKKAPYFTVRDYSIPISKPVTSNDKKELKEKIQEKVRQASIVIILADMYASYSEWIDFEIDTAVEYDKKILAVKPWNQQRVPQKITDNANEIIGWNPSKIASKIKEMC